MAANIIVMLLEDTMFIKPVFVVEISVYVQETQIMATVFIQGQYLFS